jgi:hypothetical protein
LTIICTPKYEPLNNLEKIKEELGFTNIEIIYKAKFDGYPRKVFNGSSFDTTTADILSIGAPPATDGYVAINFSDKRSKYFEHGYEITINEAIENISKSYSKEHWIKKKYENIFNKSLKAEEDWKTEWHKQNEIRSYDISTAIKQLDENWKSTRIALDIEAENSFKDLPIVEKKVEMNSLDNFRHFFSEKAIKNVMHKNDAIYKKYSDIYRNKLESIFNKQKILPITVKITCSNMCGDDVDYQVIGTTSRGTSIGSTVYGYCESCKEEVWQQNWHPIQYITTKRIWVENWVHKYRQMGKWEIIRFDF